MKYIDQYLRGVDPDTAELIRACETREDILRVAREHSLELPDEALDAIYGGCGTASYTYVVDDYMRCIICKTQVQLKTVGHDGFPNVYYCNVCLLTKDPSEIEHYHNTRKVPKV